MVKKKRVEGMGGWKSHYKTLLRCTSSHVSHEWAIRTKTSKLDYKREKRKGKKKAHGCERRQLQEEKKNKSWEAGMGSPKRTDQ